MSNIVLQNGKIILANREIGSYARYFSVRKGAEYFMARIYNSSEQKFEKCFSWTLSALKKNLKQYENKRL